MTEQEPDPPDVDLAVKAAIRLLRDVADRLREEDHQDDKDLRLRSMALRAALVRLYRHRHPEGA